MVNYVFARANMPLGGRAVAQNMLTKPAETWLDRFRCSRNPWRILIPHEATSGLGRTCFKTCWFPIQSDTHTSPWPAQVHRLENLEMSRRRHLERRLRKRRRTGGADSGVLRREAAGNHPDAWFIGGFWENLTQYECV